MKTAHDHGLTLVCHTSKTQIFKLKCSKTAASLYEKLEAENLTFLLILMCVCTALAGLSLNYTTANVIDQIFLM